MMKHLTVRSGQCPCQRYFDYVMQHLQDGTFDPTFMITHHITFDDAPKAYARLFNKEEGYIKAFITPSNLVTAVLDVMKCPVSGMPRQVVVRW
jgi:threonine dehydrogenase-like Zn-dependent dehydrogenase